MKKLLGIFVFLVLLDAFILIATKQESWGSNHFNLGQRIGLSGILCLGAGLLIITGGVDLSIGSVVGLCACVFCTLVLDWKLPVSVAAALVLMLGGLVGLLNGLLVTYLRVQAFVVTLCGLFLYRGAARWIARDQIPPIAKHVQELSDFFQRDHLLVPVFFADEPLQIPLLLPTYLWMLLALF